MDILHTTEQLTAVWKQLVVPKTVYDECAFRLAFFDDNENDLFGCVDDSSKPTVLLPLERNKSTGVVRFIGTPFLERNRGYCQTGQEQRLLALYKLVQQQEQCHLEDISPQDPITTTEAVTPDEASYIYDFTKQSVESIADLTARVSPRLAERLTAAQSYSTGAVSTLDAPLSDTITTLKEISYKRFGSDSWLEQSSIRAGVTELPTLATSLPTKVVTKLLATPAGDYVAGHIGIVHRDTYYTLFSAANYSESLPEIGTFLHLVGFESALREQCRYLDTGLGDCGWKSRWGFEAVPQYKCIV